MIVRLLDPPLHEFLESPRELAVEIAKMEATGAAPDAIAEKRDLLEKIDGFAEQNPMLGMRGCRLGIVYPILPEMQVRAIATACARLQKEGFSPEARDHDPARVRAARAREAARRGRGRHR